MLIDLTGKIFGRLTVLKYVGKSKWLCQCSCEDKTLKSISRNNLLAKIGTVSCGCLKKERLLKLCKKNWEPIEIDKHTFGVLLSKEQIALIDKEDFDKVKGYGWCASYVKKTDNYYAKSEINHKSVQMHRMIMGVDNTIDVDHIDHNTLNNRKSNLRICTKTQNNMNRCRHKDNITGFKGVTPAENGRYKSGITFHGKHTHLGTFDTAEEASKAYEDMAKKLHEEFYYTKGGSNAA